MSTDAAEESVGDYLRRVVHPHMQPLLERVARERPEDFAAWFEADKLDPVPPAQIAVRDALPSTQIYEGHPRKPKKIHLQDLFPKGVTGVLFAVIGAYTRG